MTPEEKIAVAEITSRILATDRCNHHIGPKGTYIYVEPDAAAGMSCTSVKQLVYGDVVRCTGCNHSIKYLRKEGEFLTHKIWARLKPDGTWDEY